MAQISSPEPAAWNFASCWYQMMAAGVCACLGLAMILNTQMGGEGMWFWYASLFHQGAKLYSGLHTPLQPVFVLVTDAWMKVAGRRTFATQIPSVVLVVTLCLVIFLVLRESRWPDWQKGVVLAASFALTVSGHSYRFDDYHVVAECLILFSLVVLLWIAKEKALRRQLWLAVALGVLCGLTITTRLTDGAAVLVASCGCLPFLVARKRFAMICVLLVSSIVIWVLMVKLTGDSVAAYLSNSIFRAAASKGGTGSIFFAPFLLLRNTVIQMRSSGKWLLLWLTIMVALGPIVQRLWARGLHYLVFLQLGLVAVVLACCSYELRHQLLLGTLNSAVVLLLILVTYALTPIVAVRFVRWQRGPRERSWDAREVLVLLPLAVWASYSAGAGAEPLTNYYAPIAMLLLLFPVLQPFPKQAVWANPSFVSVVALIGMSGVTSKVLMPYAWQNYSYSPMFQNREWYHHPVYGPLYIDSDLLHFSEAVCADIQGGGPDAELLSLPYPFPNYFCATPPWHGYVQTFYDTSTRATIEHMMTELNMAPPKWIVYQRQLHILDGAERLYNHGRPLAQRDLDSMILQKIATGQWQLVDKRNYLDGDGWYVLRTKP